jgi:hypothetical protein
MCVGGGGISILLVKTQISTDTHFFSFFVAQMPFLPLIDL